MIPKKGGYYCLRSFKIEGDSIIVKVVDFPIDSNQEFVYVEFVRLPESPLYCNWASYGKYDISIPIGSCEFKKAKKLTYEEMVAIEL